MHSIAYRVVLYCISARHGTSLMRFYVLPCRFRQCLSMSSDEFGIFCRNVCCIFRVVMPGSPGGESVVHTHIYIVSIVSSVVSYFKKVGLEGDDLEVTKLIDVVEEGVFSKEVVVGCLDSFVTSALRIHDSSRGNLFSRDLLLGLSKSLLRELYSALSCRAVPVCPPQQPLEGASASQNGEPPPGEPFSAPKVEKPAEPRSSASGPSNVPSPSAPEGCKVVPPTVQPGKDGNSKVKRRKLSAGEKSDRRVKFWPKTLLEDRTPWRRFRENDFRDQATAGGEPLSSQNIMDEDEFKEEAVFRYCDARDTIDREASTLSELSNALVRLGFAGRVKAESAEDMRSRLRDGARRWRRRIVDEWGFRRIARCEGSEASEAEASDEGEL